MSTTIVEVKHSNETKEVYKLLKKKYRLMSRGDRDSQELADLNKKLSQYTITPGDWV